MIELVTRSVADGIEAGVVEDGRLSDYLPADDGGIGEVHLARIRRIDPGLGAALVELTRGEGWLALDKARQLLARDALHEGAPVVVQITRPAIAEKGPRVSPDLLLEGDGHRWRPLRGTAPEADLRALFERIREGAAAATPPALLYAPERIRRLVREAVRLGVERVVSDDHLARLKMRQGLKPDDSLEVEHEPGAWQLVAEQLDEALAPEVTLAGGGSLLIEPTRALTVIDVNGHGRSPLEIDLEAADEIARQLRLRRVGGVVVVDFVDLRRKSERELLHAALRRAFGADPLPVEVLPMTRLGLVQVTRKRVGPSLDQMLKRPCPTCGGEGRIVRPGPER